MASESERGKEAKNSHRFERYTKNTNQSSLRVSVHFTGSVLPECYADCKNSNELAKKRLRDAVELMVKVEKKEGIITLEKMQNGNGVKELQIIVNEDVLRVESSYNHIKSFISDCLNQ